MNTDSNMPTLDQLMEEDPSLREALLDRHHVGHKTAMALKRRVEGLTGPMPQAEADLLEAKGDAEFMAAVTNKHHVGHKAAMERKRALDAAIVQQQNPQSP